MKRFRPVFLVVTIGIGVAGYFASTSSWKDLYKLKGAAWFGEEKEATIVDKGEFLQTSWKTGTDNPDYRHEEQIRVKYALEIDGEMYTYPYEDGFVRVSEEQFQKSTIMVAYLPEDPSNNYPVGTDFKFADQMTGFVIGILLLLSALVMAVFWVRRVIAQKEPTAQSERVQPKSWPASA